MAQACNEEGAGRYCRGAPCSARERAHLSVVVRDVGVPQLVVSVLILLGKHPREGLREHHDQEPYGALNVSYLHAPRFCSSCDGPTSF